MKKNCLFISVLLQADEVVSAVLTANVPINIISDNDNNNDKNDIVMSSSRETSASNLNEYECRIVKDDQPIISQSMEQTEQQTASNDNDKNNTMAVKKDLLNVSLPTGKFHQKFQYFLF